MSIDVSDAEFNQLLVSARGGHSAGETRLLELARDYLRQLPSLQPAPGLNAKLGASDVIQVSILEAHQQLADFRGDTFAEFKAWLSRLATHNLLDADRRFRQAQQRDLRREVPLTGRAFPEAGTPSPSSVLGRNEDHDQLWDAVKDLSQTEQTILELRHREGMSHKEIAHRLGMTEMAVRKQWSRSVESLRTRLGR